VGPESATLNARGTADNGAAHSYFEYWVNGTSGRVRATNTRHWPSGASGPFSEKVAGLYASKTYLFRVCGADDSGGSNACAQTRQLTTGAPVQDSVVGDWSPSASFNGAVNAHAGQGTLAARSGFDTFTGTVTCLVVAGSKASVGAVGHTWDSADAKESMILGVVDGGPSGTDTVGVSITRGSTTPPTCPAPTSGGQDIGSPGTFGNDIVINDAP